jgi:hypothetical protein
MQGVGFQIHKEERFLKEALINRVLRGLRPSGSETP